MTIGERIRLARAAADITQAELAAAAGVSQVTISKIESGQLIPGKPVLDRIAQALPEIKYVDPREAVLKTRRIINECLIELSDTRKNMLTIFSGYQDDDDLLNDAIKILDALGNVMEKLKLARKGVSDEEN